MKQPELRKDGSRRICDKHGTVATLTLRNRVGVGREFCVQCLSDFLSKLPIAQRTADHSNYPGVIELNWKGAEVEEVFQPAWFSQENS